ACLSVAGREPDTSIAGALDALAGPPSFMVAGPVATARPEPLAPGLVAAASLPDAAPVVTRRSLASGLALAPAGSPAFAPGAPAASESVPDAGPAAGRSAPLAPALVAPASLPGAGSVATGSDPGGCTAGP